MTTKSFRTLIIDDEVLALNRLRRLLIPFSPAIQIIDEATGGSEAIQKINELKPDLIFLDIQIPECNGFDVLAQIDHDPLVIFCTAYDEYALKAFRTNSIDYLLKPIEEKRLQESIQKLQRIYEGNDSMIRKNIQSLLASYTNPALKRIQIKTGDKYQLVKLEEICFLKADEKYVELHTKDQKHLITDSLNGLADQLPEDFVRVHRSVIINLNYVKEIIRLSNNLFEVRMQDSLGSRLPVSRNFKKNLNL